MTASVWNPSTTVPLDPTTSIVIDTVIATASQTVLPLTNIVAIPATETVLVQVNGFWLNIGEYAITASNEVTVVNPLTAGDQVMIVGFRVRLGSADALNVTYTATGGVAQSQQTVNERVLTPYDYGAVGNNVDDDTDAFNAWIAICSGQNRPGHIPEGQFVLSDKLVIDQSFELTCDTSASMRWTSATAATCGILLNFESSPDTLVTMCFPQLYSAAINSSYQIPGYSAGAGWNYSLSSRVGVAVEIIGGDRSHVKVHYAKGWTDAVKMSATTTKTCDNYNVDVGVIDFCTTGLHVTNAGPGSLGLAQLAFRANTIWAKFPIYFDTTDGYVVSSTFEVDGVFVNENGGCVVYGAGTNVVTSTIRINYADAGQRADSVPATVPGLVCPYLGGDQTSNGLSYDGMGTSPNIGYWGGQHCDITIGAAFNYIGTDFGGGSAIPVAGDTIRIRNAGRNDVRVLYAENETSLTNTAIPVALVVGEANYNGGVGGAQYSKSVYCSAAITALAAGAVTAAYVYHQLVGAGGFRPVLIVPKNSAIIVNQLQIAAYVVGTTNREIEISIRNNSAVPYTGTIFFFLEVL